MHGATIYSSALFGQASASARGLSHLLPRDQCIARVPLKGKPDETVLCTRRTHNGPYCESCKQRLATQEN